jgi:hypothetical protein
MNVLINMSLRGEAEAASEAWREATKQSLKLKEIAALPSVARNEKVTIFILFILNSS